MKCFSIEKNAMWTHVLTEDGFSDICSNFILTVHVCTFERLLGSNVAVSSHAAY